MQELVITQNVPAQLDANFEEMRATLEKQLERYDIVVTSETVGDAKKLATELNSSKSVIRKTGNEAYKAATAPADDFKAKVGEFVDMVEQSRQKLLEQIKVFEDETREKAKVLLQEYRDQLWDENSVEPEFRTATYDDLVKLTSVTGAGNLAKSAKDQLQARVRDNKALQDQTRIRLLELENQSYRAGLSAPLTRDHVQPFLFSDEDHYNSELQRILKVEVSRQEAAEEKIRNQMKRDQEREAAQVKAEPQQEPETTQSPEPQQSAPEPEQVAPKRSAAPGKVGLMVTATFTLEVSSHITDAAIEAELRRMMGAAGITTLTGVEIARERKAA